MANNKDPKYDISYIEEKNQNPGVDQPRVVERESESEFDKNADQNLLSDITDIDSGYEQNNLNQ